MPPDDPESTNRRGCILFVASAVALAAGIAWLATQSDDDQRANEVISGATL
jgi:hypothetical protein